MAADEGNSRTNWGLTPIDYDGTRTPLKTVLFIVLCVAWLLPGLVGHEPWKVDEAVVFGMVTEILRKGDWVIFSIAGEPSLEKAPLFLWTAAALAKLLGKLLTLHDAARLASGLYVGLTLGFLSLAAQSLMGERAVRMAVLLLLGCLGFLIRSHEMTTDVAGLAGIALAIYGLAFARNRPIPGGAITGVGMGLAFLGDGPLPLLMMAVVLVVLPLASPLWRTRNHAITAVVALACAAPLVALWPLMLQWRSPVALRIWMSNATALGWGGEGMGLLYFVKILPWYAWPAWPLAAWTIWRARRLLPERSDLQLPLLVFVAFLLSVSVFGDAREVNAMPLLLPLAILGVAELDSLPRGAASALDWFGMTTFFLLAALLWIGWGAALTGQPEVAADWLRKEVPGFTYRFRFLAFVPAALLTLVWLVVEARSLRSTRRAVVNWTAGIAMVWMLVMTLGVPLVDQARSYRDVSARLISNVPQDFRCIARRNVGEAQRALLDYYIGLRSIRDDLPASQGCRVLLVQAPPSHIPAIDSPWVEIWRGSRPGDRNELFILYKR
jgi:4-amino-4-deoxy-L-arabinose transferase-like glycosyltransferase